jgi:hypothetical protein
MPQRIYAIDPVTTPGFRTPALKAGSRASKIAPKMTIAPVPTEQCEADHDMDEIIAIFITTRK